MSSTFNYLNSPFVSPSRPPSSGSIHSVRSPSPVVTSFTDDTGRFYFPSSPPVPPTNAIRHPLTYLYAISLTARFSFFHCMGRALSLVAIRTQMSTLQHNIRHQQAQLNTLRNSILRGPRPLPPGILDSPPMTPSDFDDGPPPPSSFTPRIQKRSSFEVLQGMAGPDSSLPLPRRDRGPSFGEENEIREGIPTGSNSKRTPSPTRTLSRTSILLPIHFSSEPGLFIS